MNAGLLAAPHFQGWLILHVGAELKLISGNRMEDARDRIVVTEKKSIEKKWFLWTHRSSLHLWYQRWYKSYISSQALITKKQMSWAWLNIFYQLLHFWIQHQWLVKGFLLVSNKSLSMEKCSLGNSCLSTEKYSPGSTSYVGPTLNLVDSY